MTPIIIIIIIVLILIIQPRRRRRKVRVIATIIRRLPQSKSARVRVRAKVNIESDLKSINKYKKFFWLTYIHWPSNKINNFCGNRR